MVTNDLLQRVYDATNDGLDIISDLLTQVDDEVINKKKAFRLRPDERTPSAHLYPPDKKRPYWHVKDYGMGEGGGLFSPIDLYLWDRGYGQDKFRMALEELAEHYGVQETISASANKPVIEIRAARADEMGQPPRVTLADTLEGADLSCWGDAVKVEHLEAYGWKGVAEVAITTGDKVIVRRPTPTYPIFAQQCDYADAQGRQQAFYKVYEPKNPDKGHRFLISGKKPQQYLYGLPLVRRLFAEHGEQKLGVLLLVSGGSDAVSALSHGYPAVWLDSETKGLSEADLQLLKKYADRVVNIPDIDTTGMTAGRRLALSLPDIYTAWLTTTDMGGLHDNRGRRCKDLRDYCRLHPSKRAMQQLIGRAQTARFWTEHTDQAGRKEYTVSRTSLDYFLGLNGFCTLKDESRQEPVYIRIQGIVVERVTAKAIVQFLKQWMEQQALPQALRDKVLRSRDLPTTNHSTLTERDDLDFSLSTSTSQYFYFSNCWVEVTARKIITHRYTDAADHYVWKDSIIPHNYRPMGDMFTVTNDEDGRYTIAIPVQREQSKLMRFLINTTRLYWRKQDEQGQPLTADEEAEEQLLRASRLANLGYMLYGYKSESEAWATICMDSTTGESADECNGRSGKTFYLKAAAKMAPMFYIDAGNTSFRDPRFLFDGVTQSTAFVLVDECPRQFNYNFIYGMVTGDMRVEEKNRHSFVIPFSHSPKFALATNYTLSRHDPSTEGRIWPQPFSDYYHVKTAHNDYRETRTIQDDFQQNLMGSEYSEHDWQLDLSFMLQCVRFYLSLPSGRRRIMPPLSRIERREQMAAVGKDFRQWADDYFGPDSPHLDTKLKAEQVLADFNQETKFGWPPRRMSSHLAIYCQMADHIQCFNPMSVTHKKEDGARWVDRDENGQQKSYYYVQSVTAAREQTACEPQQTGLAFKSDNDDEWTDGDPF